MHYVAADIHNDIVSITFRRQPLIEGPCSRIYLVEGLLYELCVEKMKPDIQKRWHS